MRFAVTFLVVFVAFTQSALVKRQSPFNFPQGGFNQFQPQGNNPFFFPGAYESGPFNQQQRPPQQQFNNQQPTQQFNQQQPTQQFNQQQQPQQPQQQQQQPQQPQQTTPATTVSPQVQACSEGCISRTPSTYNPVCGSDGTTYPNRERFDCNVECGRPIRLTQIGSCPSRLATTIRP